MPNHANGRTNPMSATQASSIPNPFSFTGGAQSSSAGNGQQVAVDTPPEARRGAYADVATIRTNGAVSMLDFMLVDMADPDGNLGAMLTSRVFMSNEGIIALRDMLNEHTKGWKRVDM